MCLLSHSVMSDPWRPYELQPTRVLCPWDFPGKNTGLGSYSILQGIFLSQGSNLCLLHYRQFFFCLNHLSQQGSPYCPSKMKKLSHPRLRKSWVYYHQTCSKRTVKNSSNWNEKITDNISKQYENIVF